MVHWWSTPRKTPVGSTKTVFIGSFTHLPKFEWEGCYHNISIRFPNTPAQCSCANVWSYTAILYPINQCNGTTCHWAKWANIKTSRLRRTHVFFVFFVHCQQCWMGPQSRETSPYISLPLPWFAGQTYNLLMYVYFCFTTFFSCSSV